MIPPTGTPQGPSSACPFGCDEHGRIVTFWNGFYEPDTDWCPCGFGQACADEYEQWAAKNLAEMRAKQALYPPRMT